MNIHAPSDFWDGWPCGTWIYLPDGTRAQCDRCRQMALVVIGQLLAVTFVRSVSCEGMRGV